MTLHRAHWRPALVLVALAACGDSAPSSQSGDAAASVCSNAAPTCLEVPQYVLECSEDGGWRARKCEDDKLCYQGACQKLSCVPNGKQCTSGGVRTCTSDGQGWSDPVACAAGTQCDDGACKAPVCTPDAVRCSSTGTPERCSANGTGWVGNNPCPTGSGCVDGTCLPSACKQGDTTCGPTTLYTCDATGKWTSTACAAGQSCVFGRCVSCVSAVTCAQWETCAEGTCTVTTPEITTREIPPGMVSTPFSFALAATGGKAPFTWSIQAGELPDGLHLAADGSISGTPTTAGAKDVTFKIVDALSASDEQPLSVQITPEGVLTLTTRSLPEGQMDEPYSATLAATGGKKPYGWQVISGALPLGIDLFASGALQGTPTEYGTFQATFRVVDALTPPEYDEQPLTMTIKIAPLEIKGEASIPLLVLHIEAMPTLIQLVPYSAKAAKGGLKPYTWTPKQGPDLSSMGIVKWGLPSGLSYHDDGTISGWVTDVSDVSTLSIPFSNKTYTGYFDYIEVSDSQNPADTDTAIVLLPTVPILN